MTESEIKALWKEHGGKSYGPHVEHYTIEESAFYRFIAALTEAKPEVDEATEVTRKMFAKMEENGGFLVRASHYLHGHNDKEIHFQTARAVIEKLLAVPPDVEDAARWIFDNSDSWTNLAKANAQKLAEYALRGKQ